MVPQAPIRRRRNSSKVNLLISFVFHGAIVLALFFFAAREGLLGKELKKIAVEMVKEKPPEEKKPEPEKPAEEVAKATTPEPEPVQETPPSAPPPTAARDTAVAPPPATDLVAPPVVAPPSVEVPSFTFGGGRAVRTSSDPVQLYKGFLEYSLRSRWNRPADVEDNLFVAEVEISVDNTGRISNLAWKKGSGHERWDASVRQAIAATPTVNRAPPTNFPPRVLLRFDVMEVEDGAEETP